jgi:hypothetical protein
MTQATGTPTKTKAGWAAGKGYTGLQKDIEDNTREFGPRRFWLKPETSTRIIFLDDDPLRFFEHQVCLPDKTGKMSWMNWATCPGEETCPLCKIGDRPTYVGVWAIVDRTQYKDRKGQVHKDELRLFVAKPKVMGKLSRRSETLRTTKGRKEGLAGLVFDVARGDEKTASTGDDFELVGKAKAEALVDAKGVPLKVPDYMELFKPNLRLLARYARQLLGGTARGTQAPADDGVEDDTGFLE